MAQDLNSGLQSQIIAGVIGKSLSSKNKYFSLVKK